MDSEPVFRGAEWYEIPGRGHAARVMLNPARRREEIAAELSGKIVVIDGERCFVRGVEGFSINAPLFEIGIWVERNPRKKAEEGGE